MLFLNLQFLLILKVFNTVTVKSIGKSQLQIEWKSDNTGDMIADSVLAVLLQIEGSPASVKSKLKFLLLIIKDINIYNNE